MATVRRIQQYTPQPTKSDITCPVRIYDAVGNRFRGFRVTDPNNGNITRYIVEKLAPSGAFVAAWEVAPRDNLKIGVNGATMCDMGTGLVVDLWVYNPFAALPRQWYPDDAFIMDAGFERGQRLLERGGIGAVGSTEPGEVEVSKEEIADEVIRRLKQEMGATDIGLRQAVEDKVKDAIRELNMHSDSMQSRGIDHFHRDRVFEVLRDNGVIPR